MQRITAKGIALIKKFEGFSRHSYKCPAGYQTIGYGHLLKKEESYPEGISEKAAEALLAQDIRIAEDAVIRLINVPLTSNQLDALASFVFNLGAGALQRSTLRQVINRGHHHMAAEQFMRWVFVGTSKIEGLVLRRRAEAILYNSS